MESQALFINDENGGAAQSFSSEDEDDAEERLDCVHDIHSQRRGNGGRVSVLSQSHSSQHEPFENVYQDH